MIRVGHSENGRRAGAATAGVATASAGLVRLLAAQLRGAPWLLGEPTRLVLTPAVTGRVAPSAALLARRSTLTYTPLVGLAARLVGPTSKSPSSMMYDGMAIETSLIQA